MNNDSAADRNETQSTLGTAERHGETMALDLFHEMARRVPAYKDFLQKHSINHADVKTYEDFVRNVPIIDKKNYVSQYPLADLCFDGDVFHNGIISVSSGSTGVPFFWPRGAVQDADDTEMVARMFDALGMNRKKTLLVLCFSMGTWIAGTLMMQSSMNYANKGNPVSVLTPGIEKASAIDAVKRLSGSYEQVVIGGYPPFAKDVIEEGARAGIDWKALSTKFVMGGEGFSEEWRDYLLNLVGLTEPYDTTANIFGAADIGVVGYETPVSILLRRTYNQHQDIAKEVFGAEILPSLVEFDPAKRYFEKVGDELVVTSNSGIPLVRYNLKDTGGILSYEQATSPVRDAFAANEATYNIDLKNKDQSFVYLNGRKDFSITIYGVNVYPENIKAALIGEQVRTRTTGRFTMAAQNDAKMDQSFSINVELAKDVVARDEDYPAIEKAILEMLQKQNSEFRKLYEVIGERAKPQIRLITFGDQNYFARGVKHKWAKKE